MLKRIVSCFLFTMLTLLLVGCGSLENSSETNSATDSAGTGSNLSLTPLKNTGPFQFSYNTDNVVWKKGEGGHVRGEWFTVETTVEYIGDETYYSELGFILFDTIPAVYYNADGSTEITEETLRLDYLDSMDAIERQPEHEVNPGQIGTRSFLIQVPDDAPLGKYHIKLSFEGYYQIFENAIEIVE
ncbi:MAG: hypothetical protein IJC19_02925 [Clostridia bacterium]|nr:hypothetical protein [Clostridia bacterium]